VGRRAIIPAEEDEMKLVRLLGAIVSLSLRQQMAFRLDFLFQVLLTVLNVAAGVAALGIVFARTPSLGGWARGEAIVLLGTFQLLSVLLNTFVTPNLQWFRGQVQGGHLDDVLLKPASSLVLASLGRAQPLGLIHVGLALATIAIGLRDVQILPGPASVAAWLALLVVGAVITWAIRVLTACVSLYAPSLELDVVFSSSWQFARYPVTVYPRPVTFLLTYVVPVAFIAGAPALALTRGPSPSLLLGGALAAAGSVVVAHLAWTNGLRRYTSATS
jgi:ABC-2 type transport system permease protein